MKKSMAVMAALAIGISYCSAGMVTMAAQNEDENIDKNRSMPKEYALGESISSEIDWKKALDLLNESVSGDPKIDTEYLGLERTKSLEDNTDNEEEKETENQLKNLQMPQKLDVIIDPWEIDRKGQIYSEEYVIRNTGEETGILTLSNMTCKPQEMSDVVVRTEGSGTHVDKSKSIYMEMLFGTGERIVLSEIENEYEAELKPGEELTFQFTGEVNEYASGNWKNGDVAVSVVYSWEREEEDGQVSGDADSVEEGMPDTDDEKAGKANTSGDVSGDVSGDIKPLGNEKQQVSGDVSKEETGSDTGAPPDDSVKEDTGESSGNNQLEGEDNDSEKGNVKTVELNLAPKGEIGVDSWTVEDDGQAESVWYIMQNKGKSPGILNLSDLECRLPEQRETVVRIKSEGVEKLQATEGVKEEKPQDEEKLDRENQEAREKKLYELENLGYACKKFIFIEMMSAQEESMDSEYEEEETSGYQVELKPGEELAVCFSGERSGMTPQKLKEENVMVTVRYSWNLTGEAS